jgi:hypothetical protein
LYRLLKPRPRLSSRDVEGTGIAILLCHSNHGCRDGLHGSLSRTAREQYAHDLKDAFYPVPLANPVHICSQILAESTVVLLATYVMWKAHAHPLQRGHADSIHQLLLQVPETHTTMREQELQASIKHLHTPPTIAP